MFVLHIVSHTINHFHFRHFYKWNQISFIIHTHNYHVECKHLNINTFCLDFEACRLLPSIRTQRDTNLFHYFRYLNYFHAEMKVNEK